VNRQRISAWLLRLAGSVELLAFVAVVMPRSWMEIAHTWLGMGEMPTGPLIMFMIRQASYTYAMHGISLWLIASNPKRFRLLVMFTGFSYLIAGPVFFFIDRASGMPLWWTLGDTFSCACLGAALLWLNWRND